MFEIIHIGHGCFLFRDGILWSTEGHRDERDAIDALRSEDPDAAGELARLVG